MPRFSIRQLLIATAFVAAGVFALLNATPFVTAASFIVVVLMLSAAVLLAIYRDGERRAFWIGFAILGWVYMLVCFGGFVSGPGMNWQNNFTGQLASLLYDRAYAREANQQVDFTGLPSTTPPTTGGPMAYAPMTFVTVQMDTEPDRESFLTIAHALWTVLFAVGGGWFAAWLYATQAKPANRKESS